MFFWWNCPLGTGRRNYPTIGILWYTASTKPEGASLQFLEFLNRNASFIALLDSGAQLNLLHPSLLPYLHFHPLNRSPQIFRGVQGKRSRIDQVVQVPLGLSNGEIVNVEFAVSEEAPKTAILGIEFLRKIQGTINFASNVLSTPAGPVTLLTSIAPPDTRVLAISPETTADIPFCINLETTNVTSAEIQQVIALFQRYPSLWQDKHPSRANILSHRIILTTDRPLVQPPRRMGPEQQEIVAKEIEEMLKYRIIRPSKSPYSSEVVLVRKKGDMWRVCIDFRLINKYTLADNFPIPRISDLLRAIRDSSYFVALDLRAGYWQIPMAEDSIPCTAFRCAKGLFEFTVMPFGLRNAPATFQRAMEFLFGDQRFSGVLVYLDDILIHGRTFDETYNRLQIVLGRLHSANFTLNLQKCNLFPREVQYLGHLIGGGKIRPDPTKLDTLEKIRPAKNVKEIRSILGLLGQYQGFIPKFAELALPLTDLLKGKGHRSTQAITWGQQQSNAVREIVTQLRRRELIVPLDKDEFTLQTDASNRAIAGILQVKRENALFPVGMMSKKLRGAELNWPTRDKEAYAIVAGLKAFDHYLRGRKFEVHTDHQSLKWLMEAKEGRLSRWANRLAEYTMDIKWKKGSELEAVDCLSRMVEEEDDLEDRSVYFLQDEKICHVPLIEEILAAQRQVECPVGKGYFVREGVTFYHNGIWVPPAIRLRIIQACHSLTPLLHGGAKKTKSTIQKVFNWKGLHDDVAEFIKSCLSCQRVRPGLERLQGWFRTHPVPAPLDTLYLDLWTSSMGDRPLVLLTMLDAHTRWAEAAILPDKTAESICHSLLTTWICRFGVPRKIITDNEANFCSAHLSILCSSLGITTLRTTIAHPQGNLVETFHRSLKKGIIHLLQKNQSTSPEEVVQLALYAYRCSWHSSLKETPSFMLFGIDPRPPLEADWRFRQPALHAERLSHLQEIRRIVQKAAYQTAVLRNSRANEGRQDRKFIENDLILCRLNTSQLQQATVSTRRGIKLLPRWGLPCRVLRVSSGGKAAIVRNILTGQTSEVHLENARFVAPPLTTVQRLEWEEQLQQEVEEGDPSEWKLKRSRFWQEIEQPQAKLICQGQRGE